MNTNPSENHFFNTFRVINDGQVFIDCLVASADYDSFYRVMVREGQKLERAEAQDKTYGSPIVAEAKGDSKGADDDEGDSKGYK